MSKDILRILKNLVIRAYFSSTIFLFVKKYLVMKPKFEFLSILRFELPTCDGIVATVCNSYPYFKKKFNTEIFELNFNLLFPSLILTSFLNVKNLVSCPKSISTFTLSDNKRSVTDTSMYGDFISLISYSPTY